MGQVLSSSNGRPYSAALQLSDICRLSGIATELVAIRQHLTDRDETGKQLDDIVAGLDAAVTAILHTDPRSAEG